MLVRLQAMVAKLSDDIANLKRSGSSTQGGVVSAEAHADLTQQVCMCVCVCVRPCMHALVFTLHACVLVAMMRTYMYVHGGGRVL